MIKMNIKQIICEEIYKILDEHTILMEYAYKRKEYERDVSARMQQILENWCLIHYVSLTGDKEVLKNHWKSELDTLIIDIQLKAIKPKNDIEVKRKIIYNVLDQMDIDKNTDIIQKRILRKFQKENIDLNKDDIGLKLANDFIRYIDDLVATLIGEIDDKSYVDII